MKADRSLRPLAIALVALVAAAPASAQIAFDPRINFPGGDGMRFVVSADLDGNGTLDLATANKSSGTASVLLNNGDGTFAAPLDYAAGIFPYGIAAADLDRDGDADLAVANGASNPLSRPGARATRSNPARQGNRRRGRRSAVARRTRERPLPLTRPLTSRPSTFSEAP